MYELGNHYKVDVKGGKKVKPKAPVVDWSLLGSWYVPAGSKKKYFFIIIIIGVEEGRILLLAYYLLPVRYWYRYPVPIIAIGRSSGKM